MYAPAYETLYANGVPLATRAGLAGGTGWSFPTLFQTDNHWLLITEADLDGSYFGAHLAPNPKNGVFKLVMPLEGEGRGLWRG